MPPACRPRDAHRRRAVRRPASRPAEGRPGPPHRRPGARGLDEHPRRRAAPAPGCSTCSPAAGRWVSRRCRAAPRRPTFVELNPPSLDALRANIEALGVAERAHGAPGRRAPVRRAARARRVRRRASPTRPTPPTHAERLVALFRRHPFARILSVEHRGRPAARRRRHPPLRRHRHHLLPRPMTRIAIYPGLVRSADARATRTWCAGASRWPTR